MRDIDEHRTKANSFLRKAHKYRTSDPDISKICAFYAAYHAMRVAILEEPLLDESDEKIRELVNLPGLGRESRYATHHSGHARSGRGIGQNQVIMALYPRESGSYLKLHRASIDARYQSLIGEEIIDSADACLMAQHLVEAALQEKLRWKPKPKK